MQVSFNKMISSLSNPFILSTTLTVIPYLTSPSVSCLNNPLNSDIVTVVASTKKETVVLILVRVHISKLIPVCERKCCELTRLHIVCRHLMW
jgi:hypothetical protein